MSALDDYTSFPYIDLNQLSPDLSVNARREFQSTGPGFDTLPVLDRQNRKDVTGTLTRRQVSEKDIGHQTLPSCKPQKPPRLAKQMYENDEIIRKKYHYDKMNVNKVDTDNGNGTGRTAAQTAPYDSRSMPQANDSPAISYRASDDAIYEEPSNVWKGQPQLPNYFYPTSVKLRGESPMRKNEDNTSDYYSLEKSKCCPVVNVDNFLQASPSSQESSMSEITRETDRENYIYTSHAFDDNKHKENLQNFDQPPELPPRRPKLPVPTSNVPPLKSISSSSLGHYQSPYSKETFVPASNVVLSHQGTSIPPRPYSSQSYTYALNSSPLPTIPQSTAQAVNLGRHSSNYAAVSDTETSYSSIGRGTMIYSSTHSDTEIPSRILSRKQHYVPAAAVVVCENQTTSNDEPVSPSSLRKFVQFTSQPEIISESRESANVTGASTTADNNSMEMSEKTQSDTETGGLQSQRSIRAKQAAERLTSIIGQKLPQEETDSSSYSAAIKNNIREYLYSGLTSAGTEYYSDSAYSDTSVIASPPRRKAKCDKTLSTPPRPHSATSHRPRAHPDDYEHIYPSRDFEYPANTTSARNFFLSLERQKPKRDTRNVSIDQDISMLADNCKDTAIPKADADISNKQQEIQERIHSNEENEQNGKTKSPLEAFNYFKNLEKQATLERNVKKSSSHAHNVQTKHSEIIYLDV